MSKLNKNTNKQMNNSNKRNNNRRRNNPRNNNHNSKGRGTFLEEKDPKKFIEPDQDPQFYVENERDLNNLASWTWSDSLGEPISVGGVDQYFPGIGVFTFAPTVLSKSQQSNVNRATTKYFAYVTQGFTTINNLNASDMFMAVIAMCNVAMMINEGKRVYGFMQKYKLLNKYWAKEGVHSMGFDFHALNASLANFRAELNIRIAQFNETFVMPKPEQFGLLGRWLYLTSNVWCDTACPDKSLTYLYRPDRYLAYDATSCLTGTCLSYISRPTLLSTGSYFALLDELITRLANDSDVRQINGALARVYSESTRHQIAPLESDFECAFAHTDIQQCQMHNSNFGYDLITAVPTNILATPVTTEADYVDAPIALYQDENELIFDGLYTLSDTESNPRPPHLRIKDTTILYDITMPDSNPGINIDISANTAVLLNAPEVEVYSGSSGTIENCQSLIVRTEALTGFTMSLAVGPDSFASAPIRNQVRGSYPVSDLAVISKMNYHPIIYLGDNHEIFGELDNFTTIASRSIAKLHENCWFKLASFPRADKSVT